MTDLTLGTRSVVMAALLVLASVLASTARTVTVGAASIEPKQSAGHLEGNSPYASIGATAPGVSPALRAPAVHSRHRTNVNHSLQLNIYGTNGGGNGYNSNIANAVNSSLAHRNPLTATISLNEACASQWVEIWNANLKGKNYTATAHWALQSTGNANCGKFGNVAIIFGTAHPALSSAPFVNQGSGVEKKGWACVQSNFLQAWSCTAHMINGNTAVANAQALEYWNAMGLAILAGHPMWAAGDFNMNPWDPYVTSGVLQDLFYFHFEESDGPNLLAKRMTTDYANCCRYDYVFRREPAYAAYDASIWNMAYSDHHWVEMYNG